MEHTKQENMREVTFDEIHSLPRSYCSMRVEVEIANNGTRNLEKEGFKKYIAKTLRAFLKNGLSELFYLDGEGKIVAGGYYSNSDYPIIGEYEEVRYTEKED